MLKDRVTSSVSHSQQDGSSVQNAQGLSQVGGVRDDLSPMILQRKMVKQATSPTLLQLDQHLIGLTPKNAAPVTGKQKKNPRGLEDEDLDVAQDGKAPFTHALNANDQYQGIPLQMRSSEIPINPNHKKLELIQKESADTIINDILSMNHKILMPEDAFADD